MKYLHSIVYLLLFTTLCTQAQELSLVSDVWPPFTNKKGEKAIALEIVQEALNRIGYKSESHIIDFKAVTEKLESHKADGSAALWKTDAREEFLFFSESFLENQLVLVGRKGANVSIKDISALKGKTIGLVKDYAYDETLTNTPGLTIVYSKSNQQSLEKLLSEEIDYFLVDNVLIQYMLKYEINNIYNYLAIAKEPLFQEPLHFALNKKVPNAKQIISLFDKQIKIMMKDGTYNKILGMDWVNVDINHDGNTELVLIGDAVGLNKPKETYSVFYGPNKPKGYYINNVHYDSWDSIPDQYKNKIPKNTYQEPTKFGLQIAL